MKFMVFRGTVVISVITMVISVGYLVLGICGDDGDVGRIGGVGVGGKIGGKSG